MRHTATIRVLTWLIVCSSLISVTNASRPQQSQSNRRIQLMLNEGTSMASAVSPDGRTVVIDLLGSLWTLPSSGGIARRITDEFGDARQPAWSPDGRTIAFQSYRDGGWHIWTVSPDGTALKQLTSGPFDHREPHWSPDGARIAFSSDRSGNYDIWELALATGQLRQVTSDASNESMPAWSRDGREIAFVSDRASSPGIWVIDASGQERLVQKTAGTTFAPSWSPDGKLLYNVLEGTQSRLMLDGVSISNDEDVFPFRAQWLSATEFLYTADGKIKRRTPGSAPRIVDFTAALDFNRTAFTPKRRDFDSAASRPALGIMKPAISPDGKQIAFAALGDLWIMPVGGGRPQRLTQDVFLDMDPAWSRDGQSLVFSSDRSGSMDLWIRDLATGRDRQLSDLPSSERGAEWSPDGTRVAFINDSGEVYTINVEGREVQKVHDALFQPGSPTWSPDSKTLLISALHPYSTRFREGTSQILAISLDERKDRYYDAVPHHSVGVRNGDGPVWSPDGTKLAFVSSGTLWVMPVNARGEPSGPPRQLTSESADSLSWTGDSQQILYLSADKLKLLSVDDGQSREIRIDLTWQPKIPRGRKVVHAGRVFDGKSSSLQSDMDIIIEANRIRSVERHRADLHTGEVIDATGLTVMPGLIEMHSHQLKDYGERLGRIWLAYGITTVRNPAGSPYGSTEDREAYESGARPGPRMFMTGYTFDGSRIYYGGSMGIEAGPEIELELDRARRLGFDLIKTYVRLPDILQKRIVEFAHRNGMTVTSHELYPAVSFGADGVEHIGGTSRRGYSPKVTRLNHSYRDVIDLLVQSKMTITPTTNIMGGFALAVEQDPALLDDPRLRALFPASVVQAARANTERALASDRAMRDAAFKPLGETLVRITRAGGRLIAGTDSPINPYAVSLHAELSNYVGGGLTPFQALQTATVNAAEALGAAADLGTIESGKLADLIAVDGNPLEDIRAARKVRITIRNGEVFSQRALVPGQ